MPSIRQLEYLSALAETRHFRKAAEKVGVSQPTLSAQLSTLEQRLDVQLVERSRTNVMLTPVGDQILLIGRRVLRDVQEIRDLAASQRGALGGTIRLGLPPTIGPYLMPRVLPTLHKKHPDLKVYVREQIPSILPQSLAEGVHELIIAPLPVHSADFTSVPIFREPLFVVAPEEHPLAAKGFAERSDLSGEAVLALERGHQLHEQVEAICDEFGARLQFDFEGTSLDTLRQMVAMGMGISFLPGLYVKTALTSESGVVALEFKGRNLYRTIGMAWRKTSAREADYRALLEFVRQAVAREFQEFSLI